MTEAFKLMLTGMSTVFLILILVVLLGNLIIRITNKYAGVPGVEKGNSKQSTAGIDPAKMAAIISAVEISTRGKGAVTQIEKL